MRFVVKFMTTNLFWTTVLCNKAVLLGIDIRFYDALHRHRNVREEIISGHRFDVIGTDPVLLPVGDNRVVIRYKDGNQTGRRIDARHIVGAVRQNHYHFPGVGRNRDVTVCNITARSLSARDDIQLAARCHKGARVAFQISPRLLVVGRRLRNHIGHQECRRVIGNRIGSVTGRTHMTPVVARAEVIGRCDVNTVKTPNFEPLGWRVSASIHISIIFAAFPNPG
jgi:hypothetical protein